jgi:hypothetical protein
VTFSTKFFGIFDHICHANEQFHPESLFNPANLQFESIAAPVIVLENTFQNVSAFLIPEVLLAVRKEVLRRLKGLKALKRLAPLRGTEHCHQISQGGGRGFANVSRDIFSKFFPYIKTVFEENVLLQNKKYSFLKNKNLTSHRPVSLNGTKGEGGLK